MKPCSLNYKWPFGLISNDDLMEEIPNKSNLGNVYEMMEDVKIWNLTHIVRIVFFSFFFFFTIFQLWRGCLNFFLYFGCFKTLTRKNKSSWVSTNEVMSFLQGSCLLKVSTCKKPLLVFEKKCIWVIPQKIPLF